MTKYRLEVTIFWYRFWIALDRIAIPAAGLVAVGLLVLSAWLVFAPAAPEAPRPDGGYPVQLIDPLWPGATLRDGRRASYVPRHPDDGRPEPALKPEAKGGAR